MSKNMYTVDGDCPSNEDLPCGYRPETRKLLSYSSRRTKDISQIWLLIMLNGVSWKI